MSDFFGEFGITCVEMILIFTFIQILRLILNIVWGLNI